jgi:acetylornithine deacetylase/succinyl-diaminopimelate desuccinylase-like protein
MTASALPVIRRLDAEFDNALQRLFNFLEIPSISTDPAHAEDCTRAANWLAADLLSIGFDAEVCKTEGHPMVMGHLKSDDQKAPHILFYGHYDVQPPDPLDLWEAPPFQPHIQRNDGEDQGRIVARGAMDDKGQLMTFVEACRETMKEHGRLPISVTVLFEGEEESGSASLAPFLAAHADTLKADMVLVCDTLMWDKETPAITSMLRGMVAEEITIKAASRDLHSGLYGGAAQNPNTLLVQILASLKDKDGHINVPGFYDGVQDLDPEIADQWKGLGFDEGTFLGDVGLKTSAGEPGRLTLEHLWSRPTCDINGLWGGYTEEGFKTVIPAEASAKISFRLVAGQDPKAIRQSFRGFVEAQMPDDCTVTFKGHGGSPAISCDTSSAFVKTALADLTAEFGKQAAFVGCGGSIPIVENFSDALGMKSVLIGFGLEDDCAHSPNEKYEVSSFRHGARFWARLMASLGDRTNERVTT